MKDTLTVTLMLLVSAVVVVTLFRRLSLPAIIGYLLVGALIGPHAFALVADTEGQRHLAEFGVVFLMFSIGLEFSLPQLYAMRRIVMGLGGLQVGICLLCGIATSIALGVSWQAGIVIGGALTMSSTAIISKQLTEDAKLHSNHGRPIMGVFQDIAVVPLLVLIPALAKPAGELATSLLLALFKAAVVLSVLLYFGERFMRWLFGLVARQKSAELFVLTVLLVTLGLAWLTEFFGLSLALGAFVAGILIAETEYRYQVEDYIQPFRDVLLGLFFITIGMLLNAAKLLENWPWVLLCLVLFLSVKLATVYFIAMAFGYTQADRLRLSITLAAAGEFGFVLLTLGSQASVIGDSTLQIVLGSALISMLLSPFILQRLEKIVLYLCASEWEARAMQLTMLASQSVQTQGHVIICGYGRSGQSVAQFLGREDISFMAVDGDPERVRQAAAGGDTVVFGDASRREVLVALGLSRAKALVISFADTHKALAILSHVRAMRQDLPVLVRTWDETDVKKLREAGATEIVAEVIEGSLMLATQTMLLAGKPLAQVLQRLNQERNDRYDLLRGFFRGVTDEGDMSDGGPRLQSLLLEQNAKAIGLTLEVLNLHGLEVEVRTVRRGRSVNLEPVPELVLEASDIVVMIGRPESLAQAERRLLRG
jgi:monovalent cation:H+ antiporter-2, CPA2 family